MRWPVISVALLASIAWLPLNGSALAGTTEPQPLVAAAPGRAPGHQKVSAPLVAPESASRTLAHRRLRPDAPTDGVPAGGADITPQIQELARGLRNDPKLIYEFVKNTIEFVPIFGSIKGANSTLLDGRGNDFDQSSLMIALLRVAGYSPSYIYGTIRLNPTQIGNWLGVGTDADVVGALLASAGIPATVFINGGGALVFVDLAHVWVKVTISGTAYVFDPSFKTFTYGAGIDLKAAMGYDQTTFLDHATQGATVDPNYVQNLNRTNVRADLTTLAGNLITYLKTNLPAAKLSDVLADREIQMSRNESFRTSLTYERSRDQEFTDIPSAFDVLIRVQHQGIDFTMAAASTYGKRLTLFYNASNQPELRLDGTVLATGSAATPGSYYSITLTADHPYAAGGGSYADQTYTTSIQAGGQYVIMNGFANTTRGLVEAHRQTMQKNLEAGNASDSEAVRGEALTVFALTWLAQVAESEARLDKIAKTATIQHHTLGFAGQLDSPYVDIPMALVSVISTEENQAKADAAFFAQAGISSGFEWGIFEQTQDHSAVCTVKLVDLSTSQADKVFDASSANYYGTVKPQLVNYNASELATVEAYINAGFRVTLPQNGNLNELHWTGIGFIAVSPGEDSIGHIIAGGLSGGYGSDFWDADIADLLAMGDPEYLAYLNALSQEPIDLVTGNYLYSHVDLQIGSQNFPLGLGLTRSYSSGARSADGVLGRGWSHNFDISAMLDTDGFQGLGEDSPVDAAAAIAELYVAQDLLQGTKTNVRLVTATLAHRWFIERLIDNVVTVRSAESNRQFVKLPDGTYNPPPGMAEQLTLEGDGSYLLRSSHGTVQDFDSAGKLASWSDPTGNVISLNYAGSILQSISNNAGRTLTLAYTGNRISSVSDGTGRSVGYAYDGSGNLSSFTDTRGFTTTYEYDLPGRMTRIFPPSHPAVALVTNSYDSLGRVATQMNAENHLYAYYFSGRRAEEVDPLGAASVLYFDRRGRTIIAINAVGNETSSTFDGQQRVVKTTYPEGNSLDYQYDSAHNITRLAQNPKPPSNSPALVKTFTYEPTYNQPLTMVDELGRITDYSYDVFGNLTRVERPMVGGQRPTWVYTHNARGQVEAEVNPAGSVTRSYYDPGTGDRLQVVADEGGFNYTATMAYDSVGNLVQRTDTLGRITTFQYDEARHVVLVTAPAPFLHQTRSFYDEDGHLERVERETGDPLHPWHVTQFAYTATFMRASLTDAQDHIATFEYDDAERLVRVIDPENGETQYQYDAAGRLTRTIDARSIDRERLTYTVNGKTATMKDASNNTTTLTYDEYDRLRRITHAGGSFEQFTYDAVGNVTQRRCRSAALFNYTYDALNRVITEAVPSPGATTILYSYDLSGWLVDVVDASGTIHHVYDKLGRLTSVVNADGKTVQYGYDAASNRTSVVYPDGYLVTYEYDGLDRLAEVRENGTNLLAHYQYDPLSRRVQASLGDGTTVAYGHEIDGDIASITHPFASGTVIQQYGYDALNNRITFADGQQSESYGYDPVSQLVQFASSASPGSIAYQYDGPGNRVSVTADGKVTGYAANNLNQYTAVDAQAYTYDGNGNLTSTGFQQYSYSSDNHLLSATTPRFQASYAYDALGRRTAKVVTPVPPPAKPALRTRNDPLVTPPPPAPVETRYVYDGDQVLAEYDGASGVLLRRYVHGAGVDEPIAMITASAVLYYHTDAHGSVIALTNASGQVVESYRYDPYGSPIGDRLVGNPYLFAGREYDEETGLYHNRARAYDPRIGRFLQPDPLGYLGELSLYRYGVNNPINRIDPFGLDDWLTNLSNFSAGFGDTISFGLTAKFRQAFGYDDVVNRDSGFYTAGEVAGIAHGLAMGGAGILKGGSQSLKTLFYDPRKFESISKAFWRAEGGAAGKALHHWLIEQQVAKGIPWLESIANGGWNTVMISGRLNTWMGFAKNWGPLSAGMAYLVENVMRFSILGSLSAPITALFRNLDLFK